MIFYLLILIYNNINKMSVTCLTWNIWFDNKAFNKRIRNIVEKINELRPEFIAFQEVTYKSEIIIKKYIKNYHIIGNLSSNYDTIILSRYIPISWDRFLLKNTRMGRNILISVFHILKNDKIIPFSFLTFHLESFFSKKSDILKILQLKNIFDIINCDDNIILLGDTNIIKDNITEYIHSNFSDAFEEYLKIDANISKNTYSGSTNSNIKNKKLNSRLDRLFFNNKKLSISEYKLIGTDKTVYDDEKDEYIHPSDHYGIFCKFSII